MMLNSLDKGRCGTTTENKLAQRELLRGTPTSAQLALWRRAGVESYRLERRRRDSGLTGVRALASLTRSGLDFLYGSRPTSSSRTELKAALLDEPDYPRVVHMLDALPEEERLFYSDQSNLLVRSRVSDVTFMEITRQYGFVAGAQSEYEAYRQRRDLPPNLWAFCLPQRPSRS